MEARALKTAVINRCPYFDGCRAEGHASAVCLFNCWPKFQRCRYRPDWQEAQVMQLLEEEMNRFVRMRLDELIEARLTHYAVEAESPELKSKIQECLNLIMELMQ